MDDEIDKNLGSRTLYGTRQDLGIPMDHDDSCNKSVMEKDNNYRIVEHSAILVD